MNTCHPLIALVLPVCTVLWATPCAPMECPAISQTTEPRISQLRSVSPPSRLILVVDRDREKVAELAFRSLMQTAPVKKYCCIFLSIDNSDPSDAFMQRFQGTGKWVFRKGSKHKAVESDFVGHIVDRESGQRGIRLFVHFREQSSTKMVLDVGWMWGVHLGGGGFKTEFSLKQGHWREKRLHEMWIS